LPKLIEIGDIKGDLHAHTIASDGSGTIAEMAEAAIARGYEYLAITDHSKAVGIARGLDEKKLLKHLAKIEEQNEVLKDSGKKLRLIKGAEVDIMADGSLDYPPEILDQLECVVASVHSGFDMERARMTDRVLSALSSGQINILAHPTGRLIGIREPYEIDMEKVMAAAREEGVFMELNCYPERLDLNDIHLTLAKEEGVLAAISTDSHSTRNLSNIFYGIHTARRAWLEKKHVLNTSTLAELMRLLKKG
jgi:DNA polymerase (family 10)